MGSSSTGLGQVFQISFIIFLTVGCDVCLQLYSKHSKTRLLLYEMFMFYCYKKTFGYLQPSNKKLLDTSHSSSFFTARVNISESDEVFNEKHSKRCGEQKKEGGLREKNKINCVGVMFLNEKTLVHSFLWSLTFDPGNVQQTKQWSTRFRGVWRSTCRQIPPICLVSSSDYVWLSDILTCWDYVCYYDMLGLCLIL